MDDFCAARSWTIPPLPWPSFAPPCAGKYYPPQESINIRNATALFNDKLRKLIEHDPDAAFFDDQAWFDEKWGRRTANNLQGHKIIDLGGKLAVTYSLGNEPDHAMLVDGHAGVAWNVLWAQSLVARLREAFNVPISPISDQEVSAFVLNPHPAAASLGGMRN